MRANWHRNTAWYRASPAERQHRRLRRTIWWGVTSNTRDKATALLPALLNERLPELGIDFALMYPSFGLSVSAINDDELLRVAARSPTPRACTRETIPRSSRAQRSNGPSPQNSISRLKPQMRKPVLSEATLSRSP